MDVKIKYMFISLLLVFGFTSIGLSFSSNPWAYVDTGNDELIFLNSDLAVVGNISDSTVEFVDFLHGTSTDNDIMFMDTTNTEIDIYNTGTYTLNTTTSVIKDYTSCTYYNSTDLICAYPYQSGLQQVVDLDMIKIATGGTTALDSFVPWSPNDPIYYAEVGNVFEDLSGDEFVFVAVAVRVLGVASSTVPVIYSYNITGDSNKVLVTDLVTTNEQTLMAGVYYDDEKIFYCQATNCYEKEFNLTSHSVGATITTTTTSTTPYIYGHGWTDTGGVFWNNQTINGLEKDGSVRQINMFNASGVMNDLHMIYEGGVGGGTENVTVVFYPSESICGDVSGINDVTCTIGGEICTSTGAETQTENQSTPAFLPEQVQITDRILSIDIENADVGYANYESSYGSTTALQTSVELFELVWSDSRDGDVGIVNGYHMRSWDYMFYDLSDYASQVTNISSIYWDYLSTFEDFGGYPIYQLNLPCDIRAWGQQIQANLTVHAPVNTSHWFSQTWTCEDDGTISYNGGVSNVVPTDLDRIGLYDHSIPDPTELFYRAPNGQMRRLMFMEYDLEITNWAIDEVSVFVIEAPEREIVNYTYTYRNESSCSVNFLTTYGDHSWSCAPADTNIWFPEEQGGTIDIQVPFRSVYTEFENNTYPIGLRLYFTDSSNKGKNGVRCTTPWGITTSRPYQGVDGVCVFESIEPDTIFTLIIDYETGNVHEELIMTTGNRYNSEGIGDGESCALFKDDPYYEFHFSDIYNLGHPWTLTVIDQQTRRSIMNANVTFGFGFVGVTDNQGQITFDVANANLKDWAYITATGFVDANVSVNYGLSQTVRLRRDGSGIPSENLIEQPVGDTIDEKIDFWAYQLGNPLVWSALLILGGLAVGSRFGGAPSGLIGAMVVAFVCMGIQILPWWLALLIIVPTALVFAMTFGKAWLGGGD